MLQIQGERGGLGKFSEISGCLGRLFKLQDWIVHLTSIAKLKKAPSNLVSPQIWSFFPWEVELESSWGPSQPEHSCDPTILQKKITEVKQRQRDKDSEEWVRLTCVTSASAEAGCFFEWWDHTSSIVIIPWVVCLYCHFITPRNRLSPFLPFLSPLSTRVPTTECLFSQNFPGSLPSIQCFPEGEKREWKDWDLADGRQNWKRCAPCNIFHCHVHFNIYLKCSLCAVYVRK